MLKQVGLVLILVFSQGLCRVSRQRGLLGKTTGQSIDFSSSQSFQRKLLQEDCKDSSNNTSSNCATAASSGTFHTSTALFGSLPKSNQSDSLTEALILETVIGIDGRQYVVDTTRYPYRTIGRLVYQCGSSYYTCTATLVGPRTIITAAHCIVWEEYRRSCSNFMFSPGQQQSYKPFGTFGVVSVSYSSKYLDNPNSDNFDFGVLTLDTDIGSLIGWMTFGYDCSDVVQDLLTAGYPADLDESSSTMYYDDCYNQGVDACYSGYTFKHTCDTSGGQSGSPMFTYDEEGDPVIRGVHVSGFTWASFDRRNTAVFIDANTFKFIADVWQ
eukprot:TRINITY_DN1186_c1_g1_i1.p1 TRINITY_DN1186_c1_g1~~TRINITY_DN1186_c1_g1_i1.p1  ORF type:complete len:327 (+),score=22.16 TRINITY_DN1186_c1_g1_i1:141-1121(+)